MRHNRKRSNIIPADERGTPQPRCHENRGRRIVTPHVLNNGANRICILPGELGDGRLMMGGMSLLLILVSGVT